jgi:glycosyltransferase involved in cell wall biosynthesis
MRFLVLYTEMAGYFYSCLEHLVQNHEGEVLLVNWPVNKVAPFIFREHPKIVSVEKSQFKNRKELLKRCLQFDPDIIYTAGWMDKDYLQVSHYFKKRDKPVILGSDTRWRGTWRQRIASLIGPRLLKLFFTDMWVPGPAQLTYAHKLGFSGTQVATGLYTADHTVFHSANLRNKHLKSLHYPRTILYVGRLSAEKGLRDLVAAYASIRLEQRNGWSLDIYGIGPLQNEVVGKEGIRLHGFLQPGDLAEVLSRGGCLVLPSHYEPWGLVVHEGSSAGLPLLLSDAVGSAAAFLRHGENGFQFRSGDVSDLKETMLKFMALDDHEWRSMGERSAELSLQITPHTWTSTLLNFARNGQNAKRGAAHLEHG